MPPPVSSGPLTPEAILKNAEQGDKNAQYRLAGIMISAGREGEGVDWLKKAAAAGQNDARYTLALFLMKGQFVDQNPDHAWQILDAAAEAGHSPSLQVATVLTAMGSGQTVGDWAAAIKRLIAAGEGGDVSALRNLALLLILSDSDAHTMIKDLLHCAATRGDLFAGMALVRLHIEGISGISGEEARFWCDAAGQAGYPVAHMLTSKLGAAILTKAPAEAAIPKLDHGALLGSLSNEFGGDLPIRKTMLDRPKVRSASKLLPTVICDYLIGQAAPAMQQSMMMDPYSQQWIKHPNRTASIAEFWPESLDLCLYATGVRMARAAEWSVENSEMLCVVAYQSGEQYLPHFDCITVDEPTAAEELNRSGQRARTVVVALNDDFKGGELRFCYADHEVEPEVGTAVIYDNIIADGDIDEQSMHETIPVEEGIKWIAVKKMRVDPFL